MSTLSALRSKVNELSSPEKLTHGSSLLQQTVDFLDDTLALEEYQKQGRVLEFSENVKAVVAAKAYERAQRSLEMVFEKNPQEPRRAQLRFLYVLASTQSSMTLDSMGDITATLTSLEQCFKGTLQPEAFHQTLAQLAEGDLKTSIKATWDEEKLKQDFATGLKALTTRIATYSEPAQARLKKALEKFQSKIESLSMKLPARAFLVEEMAWVEGFLRGDADKTQALFEEHISQHALERAELGCKALAALMLAICAAAVAVGVVLATPLAIGAAAGVAVVSAAGAYGLFKESRTFGLPGAEREIVQHSRKK
jgi:hypothetical protein